MKIAVIGSVALHHHISSNYPPQDLDLLMTPEDFDTFAKALINRGGARVVTYKQRWKDGLTGIVQLDTGAICEVELAIKPHQLMLLDEIYNSREVVVKFYSNQQWGIHQAVCASVQVLYALKMSHRYLRNSPHFSKTRKDILFMEKNFTPYQLTAPSNCAWYGDREEDTYWYKHPSLQASKDEFFKDDVPYKYDHDDIHKAVALGDVPAYTLYMKDGAEVECDSDKFCTLNHQQRLNGVYEEACVLALERHQIPNDFKPDARRSFKIALEKVCTSITSGWFREFAWEHYDEVMAMYSSQYVDKFLVALGNKEIKPFTRGYK